MTVRSLLLLLATLAPLGAALTGALADQAAAGPVAARPLSLAQQSDPPPTPAPPVPMPRPSRCRPAPAPPTS